MTTSDELLIKIDDFEGPLDLLLHLIKETKLDIQEVPMITIVDQYLAFIHNSPTLQLDVAGEYLVMAATLLEIKSRLLLPRVDTIEDDEEVDLQELLIQQLVEYQQFKEVAQVLKEKEASRGVQLSKEMADLSSYQDEVPLTPGEIQMDDLISALSKMFQKQVANRPIMTRIQPKTVSVEEVMITIVEKMKRSQTPVTLDEWIQSKDSLIATFLAILELAKAQRITFKQSSAEDVIEIFPGEKLFENDAVFEVTSDGKEA